MEFETEKREEREKRVREIMKRLEEHYREVPMSFLEASTPWQLLFATILSAQCTDARVNKVTDLLYRKYRSVQDFADCDLRELERDFHRLLSQQGEKSEGLRGGASRKVRGEGAGSAGGADGSSRCGEKDR